MRKPVTCTRIAPLFALLRLFAGAGTAGVGTAGAGTAGVGTARAFDLGIEVEVLAAAGRPAPGVPEEIRFQNFLISPTLNAAGKVVFKGRLEGPGLGFYDAAGIWQWQAGQGVSLVIRDGEPAPGVATGTIVTGAPAINAAGELAFKGSVVEPGVFSDWGIWAPDGAGGLNLVAREGLPAELGTGAVYAFFLGEPLLNAAGQVAFRARVDGPGITVDNDCGVWAPRRGQPLRLIARELAPVPSPEAPPRVREFSPYLTLALNALGEVAFQSSFVRPLQEPGEGLYGPSPAGNLALLLRGGDPVPGLPEGHVFRGFTSTHPLQLGDEGELLVRASFDGAPIPGQDQGMWIRDRAGAFTLVALEGAEAPGVAPATPFTSLVTGVMNGARQVAFRGGVNVTRAGLWQFDPQRGVRLLALEGEPAPGFAPDMRFENFSSPHQSESGDVVFAARVSGLSPDLNHSFLDALFFVPFSGVPIAVLAAGDELEVAAGDVRTVQLVRLVQGSSSGRRILNESGQIAVQVTFSDGSPGVVVVSVPVDRDTDGDGVADVIDVCPEVEDPGQEDLDGDRVGDACPDTAPGAPVDAAGCSQAQFCAAVSPRRGWKGLLDCRIVDWRGDEPFARDCVLEFGWRGRRPSLSCRAPGG